MWARHKQLQVDNLMDSCDMRVQPSMKDPVELLVVKCQETEVDEEQMITFNASAAMQATGLLFPPGLEPDAAPASLDDIGMDQDSASASFGCIDNPGWVHGPSEAPRYPLAILLAARDRCHDTTPPLTISSMPKCIPIPRSSSAFNMKGGSKGTHKNPLGKEKVSEFIAIDETVFAMSGPDALRRYLRQIGASTGASVRVECGLHGKYVTIVGHLEQVKNALHWTRSLLEKESVQEPQQSSLSNEQQALDPVNVDEAVDALADEAQQKIQSGQDGEAHRPPAVAQMCEPVSVEDGETHRLPAVAQMFEPVNAETTPDAIQNGAQQVSIDSDVDFAECFQESEPRSVPQMPEASLEGKDADLQFLDCNEEPERLPLTRHSCTDTNEASDTLQPHLLQNTGCQSQLVHEDTNAESVADYTDWEIPQHWKQDGIHICEVEKNDGELDAVKISSSPKLSCNRDRTTPTASKKVVVCSPPDSDKENTPEHSLAQVAKDQFGKPPLPEKQKPPHTIKEHKDAFRSHRELVARLQKDKEKVCGVASGRPPPPPLPQKANSSEATQPEEKKSYTKPEVLFSDAIDANGEKQNQKINARLIPATPSCKSLPSRASTEQGLEVKNSFMHLGSESDVSDDGRTRKSFGRDRKGKQEKGENPWMASGVKGQVRPGRNLATANAIASRKAQSPHMEALNPLPQRSRAPPAAFAPAKHPVIRSANSATSAKWKERPVERVEAWTHYEEEEDPELAKYIWNSKTQKPLLSQGRPQPKALATRPACALPTTNAQRQKESMVKQVVDMGFDAASAQRALAATNWASVHVALHALLD